MQFQALQVPSPINTSPPAIDQTGKLNAQHTGQIIKPISIRADGMPKTNTVGSLVQSNPLVITGSNFQPPTPNISQQQATFYGHPPLTPNISQQHSTATFYGHSLQTPNSQQLATSYCLPPQTPDVSQQQAMYWLPPPTSNPSLQPSMYWLTPEELKANMVEQSFQSQPLPGFRRVSSASGNFQPPPQACTGYYFHPAPTPLLRAGMNISQGTQQRQDSFEGSCHSGSPPYPNTSESSSVESSPHLFQMNPSFDING